MELEELKKSWNLLDKRLQQASFTDEKQIARLVAACQRRTHSSVGRLKSLQRFSLLAGMPIVIALFAFIGLSLPASDEGHGTKLAVLLAFGAVSIALGAWWDWRTYKWIRNIRVDEMPIAEVSRRMTHFRQRADIEVVCVCVWTVAFSALYYWLKDWYQMPVPAQAIVIGCWAVLDGIVIYLFYKKLVYSHIDSIRKDIEELKDICTE